MKTPVYFVSSGIPAQVKHRTGETSHFLINAEAALAPNQLLLQVTWTPQAEITLTPGAIVGKKANLVVDGGIKGKQYRAEGEYETTDGEKKDILLQINVN